MNMNMTQLIDDIVCFIATLEWPEMYPVGYNEAGVIFAPNGVRLALCETKRNSIMLGLFRPNTMPVFKEIKFGDFLEKRIAVVFMEFCTNP